MHDLSGSADNWVLPKEEYTVDIYMGSPDMQSIIGLQELSE
jgi:hypothetical protein